MAFDIYSGADKSLARPGRKQANVSVRMAFDIYRRADKYLARPGRKQAWKHVRDTRDFNNIMTRAVIKFYFFTAKRVAEGNSRHSDRSISLLPSWSS